MDATNKRSATTSGQFGPKFTGLGLAPASNDFTPSGLRRKG